MSTLSIETPTIGQPDKTQDPKINTAFTTIQTWANGNVGTTNLESGLLAGTWEATVLGAKVEEGTNQSTRARKILGGASVEMRGAVKIKNAEKLEANEKLLTLPVGLRPPGTVAFYIGTVLFVIETAGVMEPASAIAEKTVVYLDNITFNLT